MWGGAKKNPPVTASPCQPPLGKGAKGTGDADCHGQFANWPRNDRLQEMLWGGRGRTPPLRKRYKECDAGRNPPVTASPCQPPLDKGAKGTGDADCHGQFANWPRNDRLQEMLWGGRGRTPPLRKRYKECDAGRNPPVTASPCQPPLGKGAKGTGDADCHGQFANWPRNDRLQEMLWGGRGRTPPLRRVTRGAGVYAG